MKTRLNTTNVKEIEQGFKNPFGMIISNNYEVRQAVASHARSIISKLHEERRNKS